MEDDIVIDEEGTELKRAARRAYNSLLESGNMPADVYRQAYKDLQDLRSPGFGISSSVWCQITECQALLQHAGKDLDPTTIATIDAEMRLRAKENALWYARNSLEEAQKEYDEELKKQSGQPG